MPTADVSLLLQDLAALTSALEATAPTPRRVLLVTPTHEWAGREVAFPHLVSVIKRQQAGLPPNTLYWAVVEDGPKRDPAVARALSASGLPHSYESFEGARGHDWGNPQRNKALEHLADRKMDGIVHFLDDDVEVTPGFLSSVRATEPGRVSVMAIGNLGPHGVERPLYDGATKKFTKFDAGWAERKFPIDMNAFSFDFDLLRGQRRPLFGAGRGAYGHEGFGGETEMVERLISRPEQLQVARNSGAILGRNSFGAIRADGPSSLRDSRSATSARKSRCSTTDGKTRTECERPSAARRRRTSRRASRRRRRGSTSSAPSAARATPGRRDHMPSQLS